MTEPNIPQEPTDEPKKRRGRGEDGIYWDTAKNCYVGAISRGYTASGKRRRRKVYGKTKAEVRDKLKEKHKELDAGVKSSARYTVADAVTDWLARGLKGRDPATVTKCRHLANSHIIPAIGSAKLRDLTADDVDDWLESKRKELATRSLKECHSVLRRSIAHAQRRDKVLRNVAELVTVPQGRPGRPSKALSLEQATAVLTAARGSPLHAYIVLSLLTGVRTEEARALTWDRVQLEQAGNKPPHVMVWRSVRKSGDTKTKKSRRSLALPPQVVDVLTHHRDRQDRMRAKAGHERNLVFTTSSGGKLDAANVRRSFRAVIKKAGLDPTAWTPRELRHSFVSLLSDDGVPLEDIARLVGHSSTATTELIYRKELRPVITEGADTMGALFERNPPDDQS